MLGVFTVVGGAAHADLAGAQSASCKAGSGLSPAVVTIDKPGANETVSGTITVSGTARVSLVGQLTRVEVALGSARAAQNFPDPGSVLNYEIRLDASSVPPGSATLSVTTCGLLAWGEKSVTVNVAAAEPTTTARATTTTVGGGPGTTVVGATSTSVTTVAGAPAPVGATTSTKVSTTTTTAVPTTEAVVAATVATTPPTTARPPGRDTPLVLTETPSKRSSGPPVWVGAVVGISGGLGLLFSARPWHRRTDGPPDAADPVEQDLVSTN